MVSMQRGTAGTSETAPETQAFAGFSLHADGTLYRGNKIVSLPPKELQALRLLLDHAGKIVTPAQLREALWGDVHITADSVPRCISSLRARLEPDNCIQTIYKRGYRLMAYVQAGTATESVSTQRLAITPFVSEAHVPGHLGSAIAEELIAYLVEASLPSIAIAARDSIFNLHRRGLSAVEIGRTLDTDLVLTGQITPFASHYRMHLEMIRVADGAETWIEDLLFEQSRVADIELELAQRLLVRLGTPGFLIEDLHAPAARHPEAWELYCRGRYECQTMLRHRMQDGMQLLMRALELDPGFIQARTELVYLLCYQSHCGFMPPKAAGEAIRRTITEAMNLNADNEILLPALGWVRFYLDHDMAGALRAFRQSEHIAFNLDVSRLCVMFALSRHRFEEAIQICRAALRVDPFSPWLHGRLAWSLCLAGQTEAALECVHHTAAQFPGHVSIGMYGIPILAYAGETAEALEIATEIVNWQPSLDMAAAAHAYALACAGRLAEARTMMEQLQWLSHERYVLPSFNPAVWLTLNEPEKALQELRRSEEQRCPWFFQILADPRLKPLHGNAEFERMRDSLRIMEEQAASDDEPPRDFRHP